MYKLSPASTLKFIFNLFYSINNFDHIQSFVLSVILITQHFLDSRMFLTVLWTTWSSGYLKNFRNLFLRLRVNLFHVEVIFSHLVFFYFRLLTFFLFITTTTTRINNLLFCLKSKFLVLQAFRWVCCVMMQTTLFNSFQNVSFSFSCQLDDLSEINIQSLHS